ncbi:hypothetical protein HGA91_05215 [candidate division WWE3 bacterium]|nr:hypothetical protein [candidate division WWE3 bacterium]
MQPKHRLRFAAVVAGLLGLLLVLSPSLVQAQDGSTPPQTKYCTVDGYPSIGQLPHQSVGVCGNAAAAQGITNGNNQPGVFVGPVAGIQLYINGSRDNKNPGHNLGTEKSVLYKDDGKRIELTANTVNSFDLPEGTWGLGQYSPPPTRPHVCAEGLVESPAAWPAGICFNDAMLKAADPQHPGRLIGPVHGGVIWIHPDAKYHGYDTSKPIALHGNVDGKYSPIPLAYNEWNWLDLSNGEWGLGNITPPRDFCGEIGLIQIPNWPAGMCGNAELITFADPNKVGEFVGPSVKGSGLALYLHPDAVSIHGYSGKLALHQIERGRKYERIDLQPPPQWTWFELKAGRWGIGSVK